MPLSEGARALFARLDSLPDVPLQAAQRRAALERFLQTPSGREKAGRFWRVDFESVAPPASAIDFNPNNAYVENANRGIVVYDLVTAARECPALLARAFGATGAHATKFGALAAAFAHLGYFVHVPADRDCEEPIFIRYTAPEGAAIFPATLVFAERGARVTIVERIEASGAAFVCGTSEIVTEANADVCYAATQTAGEAARVLWNRTAAPGRDARVTFANAELGAALAAGDLTATIEHPGATAEITAIFFPSGSQHVDVVSTVDHRAGDAASETVVKSAARDRGQARFLGNIRIAPHAQGSDARLRDDALLLSATAHVDSVPALEIGANDVKAYHGATVGAMDAEQIFYMESRGIERSAAERMIALGFFEPALERFPTAALRDELRELLAGKLQ